MDYKKGQIIEIDGINVCILDVEKVDNLEYIYAAEIVDEDITGNFYVYKSGDQGIIKITDSNELKKVLPIFIENMTKEQKES